MSSTHELVAQLHQEYDCWEALLSELSEAQLVVALLPNGRSIKDELGHLRAWQQVSLARMEAAHSNTVPHMPDWLAGGDPESEEELDNFNARIYETYRELAWSQVHQLWSDGFRRLVHIGEALSEEQLSDTGKYAWLHGYALADVLKGTYEHHREHFEPVLACVKAEG